ncbi:putative RING finger protein -like protein [Toxocara canis]|uniref:RING finger protein 207 n=1 Tax=Toxocara canis TaxID=6265 RepID=A0A0B2VNE7_TOXCA|nr:putative RING finger protein -like protein [Toxocara canis]
MACSSSLLMFKLGNAESRNPLECLICDREFTEPIRLPCQHSYCHDCVQGRSSCPVCGNAIEGELVADPLLTFLIETSHEAADVCANCDQISQPMHFCETCQQALCNRCRQNTHQAKMFAAHRLVPLEERARIKGRATCPLHGEPYILYSVENRSLACIICFNNAALDSRHHLVHIDAAHKLGCEKLEKATAKLRIFQDDVREQFQLRKRLATELSESYRTTSESLRQTCQEMIDTLLSVRDRLFKKLDEEKALREKHFHEQMRQLTSLQPLIRLYLLSASIFCSSASKLDFLQSSTDLMKRIQNLISMECDKPLYTGELTIDSREEFSRALEPFLGLSSILLSTGRNRGDETSDRSCGTSSPRGHHAYIKRSGSIYMNGSSPLSTKYQLVVDLAGAFGEQFARVETPLRQYNRGVAKLGKSVQEMQKDLTLRRCIIRKEFVEKLIHKCVDLDTKVGQQSALINDLQPQLQQIWQEQLDRVRRQQVLFREKIEEMIQLRENARHVLSAARQLEPFAVCLAAVSSVIDRRRCHRPDPAPMESLCLQINTIEPDSQHRIEAIEKEEQNRRLAQDQKKREEQLKFASAKKQLKTTKEQKMLTRDSARNSAAKQRMVNTTRDRSRGGTDRTLLSPCNRRHKGLSMGSRSSKSQSDPEDIESSMDDSFEFIAESASAEVETTKFECEIEEMIQLRENARHVLSAARQLEPFAVCLAAVSSVIDRRRCHRPDPAPMESLCLQINTIEPDSQHRIEAIEKEEQNRRLAQDQKKREEQLKFASAKKQLKTTKEQKMLTRDSARNSAAKQRMVNTTRDRSRGGTDRTLLSPCNRRHKGLSMGSRSSKSQSDPEDIESSMDDSFEFIAESASAEVETTKFECEHTLCRSQPLRLSAPLPVLSKQEEPARRASSSLPDDEQLSKRISDIHLSTAAKCQPCQDQKSGAPTIPRVPFIPTTIFAGISNAPSTLGAWEVREKLFESIKQKVPRVDVGATKTPEREIVNAKD